MVCHVIEVYCSSLFIEKFNALDSDLCKFFHFQRFFPIFLFTLDLVSFFVFLLGFLYVFLHSSQPSKGVDLIDIDVPRSTIGDKKIKPRPP